LSTFFFLLALYAYVWYARRPRIGAYCAVFGLFALALLAKPQVITFPFLLLLFDYWPLGRFGITSVGGVPDAAPAARSAPLWQLLREKIPLFLLSAACAVVTMLAQVSGNAVKDLSRFSLANRLETAVVAYVRYIGKAFWPAKLVQLYPHPTKLYPIGQLSAAILLLLLITAGVVARLRQQGYLAVGWFWFLGSLVPMIGLVQVGEQALADRYAYISFIGLFVMVVWLLADGAAALRAGARWLAAPAVACLLVLGALTYRQVEYWHDSETFWRHAIAVSPDNYIAERDLASVLHSQGRNDEATEHLRATLAINPGDLLANLYLGVDEHVRGNLPSALEHFQFVAQHATRPRLIAQADAELGGVYRQMGDAQKAKEYFDESLRLVPEQPSLLVTLGVMARKSGDPEEAARQFQRAAELQRSDVNGLLLAQALREAGRGDEADALVQRIQQISPNFAAAQKNAAALLAGN
jgi:tetratricopeptide (TPR) repeat protein